MTTPARSDRRWSAAIEARLVALGVMDQATGAVRRARAVRCGRCRRPVILGLDSDFGACVAECDPDPLSPYGEALARLARRRTYTFRYLGGRYLLDTRDQFAIRGEKDNPRTDSDVLVNHVCESDLVFPIQPSLLVDFQSNQFANGGGVGPGKLALDAPF